jgi:hypothetical protein
MATVPSAERKLVDRISWYTERARHSVWDRFGAEEQERMLRDDLSAGTSVSLLLFALIATGLMLSIVTVLAVVLRQ